jgi:hypothetical protein
MDSKRGFTLEDCVHIARSEGFINDKVERLRLRQLAKLRRCQTTLERQRKEAQR